MQAIRLVTPRQLEIADIAEPQPGPEDVLVEVHFVGMCGSDLNAYRGTFPLMRYPRVLGHEASGIVVARGAAVPDRIAEGARVMFSPYSECGICPSCRAGRPNCCQFNETMGLQRDGALTRMVAMHYSKVFTSDTLTLQELALTEPLSVGYHAANRGRISEADTVLVMGCGVVGIGVIAAAARKGATVIASDIDDGKLADAQRFGARHIVNSTHKDVLDTVRELTGGDGVSVAVEAVGLPQTFRLAVDAVAYAGRVVYVGYAKHDVSYDTALFVRKELDICGARNALRVFPSVIKMLEERERPFPDLITRVYPFAESGEALRAWDADPVRFTKVMIDVTA
ncbi:MAG: zinc-binding alcohol dehydrogenase family protein [Anaerolineae bacterium]|nr:zinc-binding alcohol dehydrogenase family protein [Anaerolineae bacterium]MCB0248099.1 zinc-binding alcohol dehydrogenase family protein [Anaerolineae bacterium]MCB9141190.1 zinc-binding alcohol dehydrogenase family protein [Anaerolineales bacterium]MCO5243659.1 zinc-binding alcohol dehydrogenase family protein [Anaerolineae bacterium]